MSELEGDSQRSDVRSATASSVDVIDPAWIRQQIATKRLRLGYPLSYVALTASTNCDARGAARDQCPDGALWIADQQSAGRGSHERGWLSPAAQNIYMSVVVRPHVQVQTLPAMTLCVGLAVAEAVQPFISPARACIKWPNDVLICGRKAAGILLEGGICEGVCAYVVIGIGINVHQRVFDESISATATSLALYAKKSLQRQQVIVSVMQRLQQRLDEFECEGLAVMMQDLDARDITKSRLVQVQNEGESTVGTAMGIAADGRLRVRIGDAMHLVTAGQVQVLSEMAAPVSSSIT